MKGGETNWTNCQSQIADTVSPRRWRRARPPGNYSPTDSENTAGRSSARCTRSGSGDRRTSSCRNVSACCCRAFSTRELIALSGPERATAGRANAARTEPASAAANWRADGNRGAGDSRTPSPARWAPTRRPRAIAANSVAPSASTGVASPLDSLAGAAARAAGAKPPACVTGAAANRLADRSAAMPSPVEVESDGRRAELLGGAASAGRTDPRRAVGSANVGAIAIARWPASSGAVAAPSPARLSSCRWSIAPGAVRGAPRFGERALARVAGQSANACVTGTSWLAGRNDPRGPRGS